MSTVTAGRDDRKRSRAEESFRAAWPEITPVGGVMATLREKGFAAFEAAGLPSSRVEAWKYTSLRALSRQSFRPPGPVSAPQPEELDGLGVDGLEGPRLVFLDGRLQTALSDIGGVDGLQVEPLDQALAKTESAADLVGALGRPGDHPFVALNQAFLGDGVFIRIVSGAVVEQPLYLMFLSCDGGDPVAAHPRVVVDAGAESGVVLVEQYTGAGGARNLTNAVTEIRVADGGRVEHYRLQEEPAAATHLGALHARLERDAVLVSHNVQLGAALARLDLEVSLTAPGATVELNGLYFVDGKRHVDNHTRVDHLAPETRSDELYRGVIDDRGRAVFNGKAIVHPDAQRIEAHQSNRNLLLSRQAEVDTKPELEIYADDVKCSHGATVGQLDRDAMFYLLSRGIERQVARDILTFAFVGAVAARMGLDAVRDRLETRIAGALPDGNMIRGVIGAGT